MTFWRWAVMGNQQWPHPGNLESLPLSGTQSIFRWKFNPIYLFLIIHKKDPWFFITQDLFYLLPYHHLEFPLSLKKLIIIDVDLEFSVDMLRLYKWVLNSFQTLKKIINKLCSKFINNLFNFRHFDKLAPSEVLSCGVTQSPFYFGFFKEHRWA